MSESWGTSLSSVIPLPYIEYLGVPIQSLKSSNYISL